MRRSLLAALALLGCASEGELRLVRADPSDAPLAGLDAHWSARFAEGDAAFDAPFRETQGLGPLFIRISCVSCHEDDARGPGAVRKMAALDEAAVLPFGPTLRPQRAAGATRAIEPPPEMRVTLSRRFGPAVFGRGYIEAIADEEIVNAEASQAREGIVSGRVHRVPYQSHASADARFHEHALGATLIGRFGHKARVATIDDFVADAYQGDMGITTPLRPEELPNPDGLDDDLRAGVDLDLHTVSVTADYVRLLAIPPRAPARGPGAALFAQIGCARCHVPSMRTRDDYPIALLAGVDAPIYSDLLLHDMGEGLADGIREHDASGREWRTAPLIGLRHLASFLHDGRAASIEEAIDAHGSPGSEASSAVDAYRALGGAERATVVAFVEQL